MNLANGVRHPSDRSAAIQMFRILRDAGENYDPDQVRALAVQNGWQPDHARELAAIGQQILDGKALRDKGQHWGEGSLERWREAAAN